ncbi:MAG: hypothetical protein LBD44_02560 [Spirochaetaceae bacterium]|nr:hypothetical protein [Spirochaetaceae bacterium]
MRVYADKLLPVELVFSPQWWYRQAGITFDRDFFFHPARRVEDERKMEKLLYEKWGGYGLGNDRDKNRPEQGAVHLASGYLLSEMMGCKVEYREAAPPQVICRYMKEMDCRPAEGAFESDTFKAFSGMREKLKTKYGHVTGDVNWSGILNLAIDLRGPEVFEDMAEEHEKSKAFFNSIAAMIEKFTDGLQENANSTSVSVNRNVAHLDMPVLLHSECSLTMISESMYREYILPHDLRWSRKKVPFGIHYCGPDPQRFAAVFAEIPDLAFLDLGYGGDVAVIRKYLPNTFLNIRLSPVEIARNGPVEVRETVIRLVRQSADYRLTGICCINMDDTVKDENVDAIFEARKELLEEIGAL